MWRYTKVEEWVLESHYSWAAFSDFSSLVLGSLWGCMWLCVWLVLDSPHWIWSCGPASTSQVLALMPRSLFFEIGYNSCQSSGQSHTWRSLPPNSRAIGTSTNLLPSCNWCSACSKCRKRELSPRAYSCLLMHHCFCAASGIWNTFAPKPQDTSLQESVFLGGGALKH